MLTSTQHIQHAGEGGHQPGRTRDFQSLPPQQFQVLFNSLFKVLFILSLTVLVRYRSPASI